MDTNGKRAYDISNWFEVARIRQLPMYKWTTPSKWRLGIVCTDDCDNCPIYLKGCGRKCNRFPDAVCEACPCRASVGAVDINEGAPIVKDETGGT